MPAPSVEWYSPSLICTWEARLRVLQNWQDFYACGGPLLRNKLANKYKYKIQNTQYQIQRPFLKPVRIANTKKNCCWLTARNALPVVWFSPFHLKKKTFFLNIGEPQTSIQAWDRVSCRREYLFSQFFSTAGALVVITV